ncbi:MAG: hypothetical protein QM533_11050 [Cytophagales bacterium]|nr:hypothetical protein [Cytophagales bacterium]
MKSKLLSKLTLYVFLWTVLFFILIATKNGNIFLDQFISTKQAVIILGVSMFTLFFLFASRVISYLFLSGHKGQSIETLIFSYRGFYILLTQEARQEWRDFIAKEKIRAQQITHPTK